MGGGEETPPRHEELLIAVPFPEPPDTISNLKKSHPQLSVTWIQSNRGDATPPDLFKSCTILVTFATLPDDPSQDAPHLRWVHILSAGVDHLNKHPIYTSSNVVLTTSNGVAAPQIAEWVIMTLLTAAHNYNRFYDQQKAHFWNKDNVTIDDFPGQRIGILGYGSIGRNVGRIAKALGMDVLAYTASPKKTKESRKDAGYVVPGTGDPDGEIPSEWFSGLDKESLHRFLGQDLDIVVLTLPLTNDTRHLLGADEFSILSKKKAFISNISRGPIIQQDALITAIKAGKLRGAALDVTDPEPLPKDSELWDLPSVTVTPHYSGNASAYFTRGFQLLGQSLERWAKGEQPINVVDRRKGY